MRWAQKFHIDRRCNETYRVSDFFALNGSDHHPTRAGHEIMGEATALYIAERMTDAAAKRATLQDPLPEIIASIKPDTALSDQEQCYNVAVELPVHHSNGTWRIAWRRWSAVASLRRRA